MKAKDNVPRSVKKKFRNDYIFGKQTFLGLEWQRLISISIRSITVFPIPMRVILSFIRSIWLFGRGVGSISQVYVSNSSPIGSYTNKESTSSTARRKFCRTGGLALFAIMISSSQVQAQPEMFAGYDSFCGLPVIVGNNPQDASARRDANGAPYIHIDPSVMANWSLSRIFALAHECAHHRLGHTTSLGMYERYTGGTGQQELEADCWAAEELSMRLETDDIIRTIVQYANQGHYPLGGGYPSGAERARNIFQCANDSWEPCDHPAHPNGHPVQCQHFVAAHSYDLIDCGHLCQSPIGIFPCHPQGDSIQCQHPTPQHAGDMAPCDHQRHPEGH